VAPISYRRHRFPPVVIQHAVWLYLRFTLSYRDIEEFLAEPGLDISHECVRRGLRRWRPRHESCRITVARLRDFQPTDLPERPRGAADAFLSFAA